MTRSRSELFIKSTDRKELDSARCELVTDGGEDLSERDDILAEAGEEHVEYYPDGFVSGEPVPEPSVYREGHTDEYYVDAHLRPGPDDPKPPWGYEDGSARPHGPPCRDCGEKMTADSLGWAQDTGQNVDRTTCEDCGLGWGPVSGWFDLDSDDEPEPVPDGGLEHSTTESEQRCPRCDEPVNLDSVGSVEKCSSCGRHLTLGPSGDVL